MKRAPFKQKRHQATPDDRKQRLAGRAARALAVPSIAPRGAVVVNAGMGVPVVKEAVKAKPGKHAPTAEERAWMDAIVAHGCICCILDGQEPRPTAVHHILRGGQRIGHLFTLPLCQPGHHMDGAPIGMVSRHPWRIRFEEKYGTELELLAMMQAKINPAPPGA